MPAMIGRKLTNYESGVDELGMTGGDVLFTIICPTFNRCSLIERAISSVLRQSYHHFELIIVNDGSTDNTREVVQSFVDSRIVYVEHEKNRGMNAALNTGFERASGRYVSKLDDDDELASEALEKAVNEFKACGTSRTKLLFFIALESETKAPTGRVFEKRLTIGLTDLLQQKLRGDYWVVVERGVLPPGRILDEDSWGALGFLWLRILREYDALYIPQVVYYAHRKHGLQRLTNYEATRTNWRIHEHTTQKLLDEFGTEMKLRAPKAYSRNLTALAFYQIMNGKFALARSSLRSSLQESVSVITLGLLLLSCIQSPKITLFVYTHGIDYLSI